ncbi:MAG: ABC transporter permease, partial [Anaerolineae bacterium]|nr:ABC transporter permease [Anaerolineae bacterium]
MTGYILRRLGYMLVTLVMVTIVGFALIELPPGSYLEFHVQQLRNQGGDVTQAQIQALERRYGLNDPVYVKFWKWISGFPKGDFGESFQHQRPVSELIWDRLGYTVAISVFTLILSWSIAIVVGVYSATHRYTIPDYTITALQFAALAIPNFLLALVLMVFLQQVFGTHVGALFSSEYRDAPWSVMKVLDLLGHLWVPVLILGVSGTAWTSRVMRANLLDVLNMQYVQTARAKGVPERTVIWKHAVRNALHPLVMTLGMSLPGIISGETVVATVLNLPTSGPIYFQALMQQDMYLAGTFLVFLSVALLIGNLIADITLAWLDP